MTTPSRSTLLAEMRGALKAGGIENPALDARILLLRALRIEAIDLLRAPETLVAKEALATARGFITRRLQSEPVARIIGSKEFYGLDFGVNAATLVPRPDTETLVDAAFVCLSDTEKPWCILDLGTGSGAIAIALLSRLPNAWAVGLDLSLEALSMARENARRNRLDHRFSVVNGSWCDSLSNKFDLIVANPPYIPHNTIASLSRDVRLFDPALALDGGPTGLDAYRIILEHAPGLLKQDGYLLLELGIGQASAVLALADGISLRLERLVVDFGDVERVLVFRRI